MNTNQLEHIHGDSGFIHDLTDLLSQLYGLPGYVLVCLSCIIVGYLLKLWGSFPNKAIPVACVLWGTLLNALIAPAMQPGDNRRIWLVTHLLVGMCVGIVAWLIHNKFLKKFENDWPFIGAKLAAASDQRQVPVPPAPTPPGPPTMPPQVG